MITAYVPIIKSSTDTAVLPEATPSGGIKEDAGKPRWGLLPYDAVEEVVKVLTYGAAKYKSTTEVLVGDLADWTQQQLLLQNEQLTAIQVKLDIVTDSVEAVTKKTSEKLIPNLQSGNWKTEENGENPTSGKLANPHAIEGLIHIAESATKKQNGEYTSEKEGYTTVDMSGYLSCKKTSAEFATETCKKSLLYTLTTTIKRELQEDSFAVDATTASECLRTLSECLRKQSVTLKIPRIISCSDTSIVFEVTGDRNWEQGIDFERLFSAAQRHQTAWWQKKEDLDESGFNHLAHATCELLFLLALQLRGQKSWDNRPR